MEKNDNKKAISALIATVLLILITIAGVAIIAGAVIPMITKITQTGQACTSARLNIDTTSGFTCYDSQNKLIGIMVARGAGEFELSKIAIIIYGADGNSKKLFKNQSLPGVNSASTYVLNASDFSGISRISVASIVKNGNREKECDISSKIDSIPTCAFPLQLSEEEQQPPTPQQNCSDGTLYGTCSATKPLYCSNGNLVNNCSVCGCDSIYGYVCQPDGSCQVQQQDLIPPIIAFTSPTPANGSTIYVNSQMINVTSNENVSACILSWDPPIWCYQESANVSTACGGLNTGTYSFSGSWVDPSNTIDGNWGTYGYEGYTGPGIANLTVNYSKPTNASSSSLWQVKSTCVGAGCINSNHTIPSVCWNAYSDRISFILQASDNADIPPNNDRFKISCWNGTAWQRINGTTGDNGVSEEAMWWYIEEAKGITNYTMAVFNRDASTTANYTITGLTSGTTYLYWVSCNDTSGNVNKTGKFSFTSNSPFEVYILKDVAIGKSITAGSYYCEWYQCRLPQNAVNGIAATRSISEEWHSSYGGAAWLRVDLGNTYNITAFQLFDSDNQIPLTYTLYYSNDDSSWTQISSGNTSLNASHPAGYDGNISSSYFEISPTLARYWKIDLSSGGMYTALSELALYIKEETIGAVDYVSCLGNSLGITCDDIKNQKLLKK